MPQKSIKKNYVYNLIYQILVLVTPLITTPYVSRVLTVDGIGLYSYANSIVSYFVLFGTLGTTTFAQRAISYKRDDIEARSREFWEISIFRAVSTIFFLIVYLLLVFFIFKENYIIYIILSLNIINIVTDVSWFLQGLEEFGKTVLRNVIIKILSIVFIFLFVKSSDDLWIYILLMVGFTTVGNISLWFYLPKYLCRVTGIRPFKEWKIILQFFIPTVAVQIYTILDKSMIGWFCEGDAENGYYEQAEKVIKMALAVVTSLGTVMIPRISKCFASGEIEKVKYYVMKSYKFVWMLSIPMAFGIIAVSGIFVPIFFGDGYNKCAVILPVMSILCIAIGLSNVTGMQLFIPTGKQNYLTLTVIIGAIVNCCLNLVLIPKFASLGACISSVIAETCVTIAGFIVMRVKYKYKIFPIIVNSWKYFFAAIVMFVSLLLINKLLNNDIIALITLCLSGVGIYFIALIIIKDELVWEIINRLINKIKGRRANKS